MTSTRPSGGPIFADGAIDQQFAIRGYVVHPFLDAAEVRAMEHVHAEIFPELLSDFSATTLDDSTERRWRVFEKIRAIVDAPLRRIVPHHKMALATFVTKRPRTTQGRVPLHQDWWIADNRVHRALHFWCPLVDVGPESGCLKIVPGVHRLLNDPYPIHPKFRTAYHPRLSVLDGEFALRVPMPAGAALLYDQRMLHGSDENRSDRMRVAFNCIMIPEDLTPLLYQWTPDIPDRLQVLEVDERYLCEFRFGVPLAPPYPQGVRLVDTIPVATSPLSDGDFSVLRDMQRMFADEDRKTRACADLLIGPRCHPNRDAPPSMTAQQWRQSVPTGRRAEPLLLGRTGVYSTYHVETV